MDVTNPLNLRGLGPWMRRPGAGPENVPTHPAPDRASGAGCGTILVVFERIKNNTSLHAQKVKAARDRFLVQSTPDVSNDTARRAGCARDPAAVKGQGSPTHSKKLREGGEGKTRNHLGKIQLTKS